MNNINRYLKHTLAITLLLTTTQAWTQTCNDNIADKWPDSRYTDHNNGTVTDNKTGLMWMQCSEGQTYTSSGSTPSCTGTASTHTWKAALELAKNKDFAGHSDWRLPNIKELASLVVDNCHSPTINLTRFPNTPSSWFWSSSADFEYTDSVWFVDFNNGVATSSVGSKRLRSFNVRLVRAGN